MPDLKRKLPGRGIWITADRAALDEAVKRKVFARGFKREVRSARSGRADRAAAGARRARCAGDRRQGGPVAAGFAKVEAALARERVAA